MLVRRNLRNGVWEKSNRSDLVLFLSQADGGAKHGDMANPTLHSLT